MLWDVATLEVDLSRARCNGTIEHRAARRNTERCVKAKLLLVGRTGSGKARRQMQDFSNRTPGLPS